MIPNPGYVPTIAKGKRVRGILANGHRFGFEQVNPVSPLGWTADSIRWSKTGSPFDVKEWELCA